MNWLRIPNRAKYINELTRRYDEVLRHAEKGVTDDEQATQFLSLLAHYMQYVHKHALTKDATDNLFVQKEKMTSDDELQDEAVGIIERMKKDRAALIRYAKTKNISTDNYVFRNGQTLTQDIAFAYDLDRLNEYLNLPADQQSMTELPENIGHLLAMNWQAQDQGGKTSKLGDMREQYQELQKAFEKKLILKGVFMDYLRLEDFNALNTAWKVAYREGSDDELQIFHFEYAHLFDKGARYNGRKVDDAKEFVGKHLTHLQRLHNYLIDALEDTPKHEKLFLWIAEHFAPTLFSLVILWLIVQLLHLLGINIPFLTLKSYI